MRLATLGFSHETNTFSRVPADYAQFERTGILRGEGLVRHYKQSTSTLAGYLQAADELGFELVPLYFAHTNPMGLITRDAFERIVGEMLELLKANGPWDGILLAQH